MPFAVTPDALDALATEFRRIGEPLHSGHPTIGSLTAPDSVLHAIGSANRHLNDSLDAVSLDVDALSRDLSAAASLYRTNEAELAAATASPPPSRRAAT
jgi:hypothetical protein